MVPPPTVEELLQAWERYPTASNAWEARFLLMSKLYTAQTQELGNCNLQLRSVRDWSDAQTKMEQDYERRRSSN